MKRFITWCAVGLAAALLCTAPARADISFGYEARYVGLGGAGLALVDNPTQAALINPAALSLRPMNFGIEWPNLAVRMRGADMGDAFDQIASGTIGAVKALDLARSLGQEPTRLEANLGMGVAASVLDLRARTQANIVITPGASFSRWAMSGQDMGTWIQNSSGLVDVNAGTLAGVHVTDQASLAAAMQAAAAQGVRADVSGAAVIAPSIGFGFRVPTNLVSSADIGDLRMGFRVKPTQIYYSHWQVTPDASQVTAADIAGGPAAIAAKLRASATAGSELGTRTSLSNSSVGADMGMLWQPGQIPFTTFALTVDNLLEPSFKIPNAVGVPNAGKPLLARTLNLGMAIQAPAGVTLAADLIDLTGANGAAQFRAGAEFHSKLPILRWFTLRAGYNSATGLAGGIGIAGFGISYANRAPLVASQTLNF